jgi:hypothetical protein
MDDFDGTTKRKDLDSVVGTYPNSYSNEKLIKVGDAYCTFENKVDGRRYRLPSEVAWNMYFF